MTRKLFVGNLPYTLSEQDLAAAFAHVGDVEQAIILTDRETGRSRGFGFVTMASAEDAAKAIETLHESTLGGRRLTVNPAQERQPRNGNGHGGNGQKRRDRDHRGAREPRW